MMESMSARAQDIFRDSAMRSESAVWEDLVLAFAAKLDEMNFRLQEIQEKVSELWDERESQ